MCSHNYQQRVKFASTKHVCSHNYQQRVKFASTKHECSHNYQQRVKFARTKHVFNLFSAACEVASTKHVCSSLFNLSSLKLNLFSPNYERRVSRDTEVLVARWCVVVRGCLPLPPVLLLVAVGTRPVFEQRLQQQLAVVHCTHSDT